jgi:hemolysin activation/secretion protein/outer membrane protein OmpA-like peptidoglycan-associated protein
MQNPKAKFTLRSIHLATLSTLCFATYLTQAQAAPDAGSLSQQAEQESKKQGLVIKAKPEKGQGLTEKPVESAVTDPVTTAPQKPLVATVKSFTFTGNTKLTAVQLAPVVASYLNRPINFAELQKTAAAVANAYRDAGWIVRTALPTQDIVDGKVTIQIIEAVFGGIKIEGAATKRVPVARVLRGFEAHQAKGAPINTNALDRELLLADDLPGVAVGGSLREGANAGETDIVLKLADEPLVVGEVGADNFGSRSTGANRFTGNLNLNSPFKAGDLFSSNLIHTDGSDYVRMAYSLPVGAEGWRVGVNTSSLVYKLIAAEFASLDGKGTSVAAGVEANYPVIRSRLKNLYLGFNYDNKQFDNQSSGATQSNYQVDNLSMWLNGNLFDELGGGGANSYSFSYSTGQVSLGKIDSGESTALKRDFSKLRYNLSRQQAISENVSLFAAVSGQESGHNDLDSSEKFYLGGANGVRAYPTSEGGGSTGNIANLELRWRLPRGFIATTFYDYGQVTNFNNAASYALQGAGLGLAWQSDFGLNLKATWAHRIGENPNPTSAGNDQDGSLVSGRFWLAASIPFTFNGGGKSSTDNAQAPRKEQPLPEVATPAMLEKTTAVPASALQAITSTQPETISKPIVASPSQPQSPTAVAVAEVQGANTTTSALLRRDIHLIVKGIEGKTATLSPEAKVMLDDVAKAAALMGNERIEIGGHTDRTKVSQSRYNMKLSIDRASVAQQYLISKGVPESKIKIVGYGFTKPMASNETQAGRDQTRRVEIKLID